MLESVVAGLLNRFLAAYVDNLNTSQLNIGIWSGDVKLKNLRLKKEALDKFRLPIDVAEGYLGDLTLSIPWSNLKGRPCRVLVENVYLLAKPAGSSKFDPEEDARRAQQVKREKLENSELLLSAKGAAGMSAEEERKNQSFATSLVTKILDNLQVTVRNIHVRYEDNLSCPERPFSAGITLAEFSAVSTDGNWVPTFINDSVDGIHKLAKLESLAVYWDTESESLEGYGIDEAIRKFTELIAKKDNIPKHQFILKPVTGEGRLVMNHQASASTPKLDLELLFDEIGFAVDGEQYSDALLMLDLFHFYIRQSQYRALRPPPEEIAENKPRALLKFAGKAILNEVHERARRWSWAYFAERRDDRKRYVELYKTKKHAEEASTQSAPQDAEDLAALERKLSYEDIRFYRSIARSELRKERAARKETSAPEKAPTSSGGWLSWIWGNGGNANADSPSAEDQSTVLNEEQLKELYDAIEWDEKTAVASAIDLPRDALKMRVAAKLNTGSFALRSDRQGRDVVSLVFDAFAADILQRPDNLEAALTLGGLRVYDGTTPGTLYPQIVRVKGASDDGQAAVDPDNPFFYLKFENNPLDERADNAVTLRMRHVEVFYHRGYVEEIVRFFKPPESRLESINALIDVASESLDAIRKQTRAGFEYALAQHRTVDLRVDMNAPIIILPEDVTTRTCQHMVLDAGHIAVESDLVDKDALQEVRAKQNQQYSEDDWKRLESLMYDKFFLKLKAAQLLIGNDLDTCLRALERNSHDADLPELHLVEKINIDLSVHNSILASAPNLARFKVAGQLPTLKVNISDRKYQSMMRIIDVAIPHFDDGGDSSGAAKGEQLMRPELQSTRSGRLFGAVDEEYGVDLDESRAGSVIGGGDEEDDAEDDTADTFFEAPEAEVTDDGHVNYRQRIFQLDFRVDKLQASLFRTGPDGSERSLADAVVEGFSLGFALRQFDMSADVLLRSLSVAMVENGVQQPPLITSEKVDPRSSSPHSEELVRVKYARVQPESPEYMTVHEGIDQSVETELSTINIHATPGPILELYAFIMETFVPKTPPPTPPKSPDESDQPVEVAEPEPSSGKIRVKVKLTSIVLILDDGGTRLATLVLSAGDVALLLRGPTLRLGAHIGGLSISDDSDERYEDPSFKQILSIEGDELADFRYETFDPHDAETYPGYNSSVFLRTASLKFTFNERPVRDLYRFLIKFARLKALYDAASQAAVGAASEVQRMQYDIVVRSPILVVPMDGANRRDSLVLRLGEGIAKNSFSGKGPGDIQKISAGLHGARLTSKTEDEGALEDLPILDNVNFDFDITQLDEVDNDENKRHASMEIHGIMSDVKVALTQTQYVSLYNLSQSIPRVLASEEGAQGEADEAVPPIPVVRSPGSAEGGDVVQRVSVDLNPELGEPVAADGRAVDVWTTLEFTFGVQTVSMDLYTADATSPRKFKSSSIAQFSLNDTRVKFKQLSDAAMEAEVTLKSLRMDDTRPNKATKFRQLIPPAAHDGHQLMIHYTADPDRSALALVSVDSPKIIFSIDPLFALVEFFLAAFPPPPPGEAPEPAPETDVSEELEQAKEPQSGALAYRVNVVNASIIILASETDASSEAIELSVKQVLMSQQGIVALKVDRLGMFLSRMDRPKDKVRFLDNFDLTLSLDSRQAAAKQKTNIELQVDPIIFRASYRDIMLITTIVNKAIELSTKSRGQPLPETEPDQAKDLIASTKPKSEATSARRPSQVSGKPKITISQEHLKATIDSFQVILIGDVHEIPFLHLTSRKFSVEVDDWSGELKARTAILSSINYFNPTNSHWEPLMDPWDFTVRAERLPAPAGMSIALTSRKRLEFNLTSAFIELALFTSAILGKEGERLLEKPRGGSAPFLLRNRTGYPMHVWATPERDSSSKAINMQRLEDQKEMPWRFDDPRTLREDVLSASVHNSLGVQLEGTKWERLSRVSVDCEGEHVYVLRPKLNKVLHRLVCDIKLVDNVKIVTFRSSYKVENLTLVPIELVIIGSNGKPASAVTKIPPGGDCALPIEAAYEQRVKFRPDPGFEYAWSTDSLYWQDLIKRPSRAITCRPHIAGDAPFRFQAHTDFDPNDPVSKIYPKLTLRLRAPIEVENLLPYDITYRVFDKNTKQDCSSFLRSGGISPLHLLELSHLVLLSVVVQDSVLKPSEFAIINTDNPDDFPVENTLVLSDPEGLKLNIRIHLFRYPNSGGAFKVQIYSPYVLFNKTGLDFALRSKGLLGGGKNVAGQDLSSAKSRRRDTAPFMFSHNSDDRQKRFLLRVGDSNWSRPISFDVAGADTEVKMPAQGNENVHIGMSVAEGLGKYKLTKVVELQPRFLINSKLAEPINVRVDRSPDYLNIRPGDRTALHRLRAVVEGEKHMLKLAYPGSQEWSAPFGLNDIGPVHLRMGDPQNEHLVKADVYLEGPTIFVYLKRETGPWPFKIQNNSDTPIDIWQSSEEGRGDPQIRRGGRTLLYRVEPHSAIDYAWDAPAELDKKLRIQAPGGRARLVDLMEIGTQVPYRFGHEALSVDVRADGPRQVLVLAPYSQEDSLYQPRRRSTSSISRSDTIDSSIGAFEEKSIETIVNLQVNIEFEGIGISVVNKRMQELVYASFRGLGLQYADTNLQQSVNLACKWIQIDNQLFGGLFPIILYPTSLPRDGRELERQPTLDSSLIISKDGSHGVLRIDYFSLLLQAMTIELDEDFVMALIDFSKFRGASWEQEQEDKLTEHPDDIPEPKSLQGGVELYFQVLHLQPISLDLSFMRTDRVNVDNKTSTRNPLMFFFNALTMALGNVSGAPVRLNALVLQNARFTSELLTQHIIIHYRDQFLYQLYRVLGSADFLGNPVGLFTNVSSGFADIFYEPYQGLVMHGNKELGIGIARGATSFVKKTVFGVTDSVSKVTGSIGKGLSAATLDQEYQNRRRMTQRRNKPKHALYGVAAGANAFATSVASGFEGLALKPIEGAERDGAAGFFKGVGRGLVGAVTKPVIGVFDLASNVTEGIRNTTTVFDQNDIDRIRLPRYIPRDGVLRPYSEREALGQSWLKNLGDGQFFEEDYVAHLNIPGSDHVVMLTTKRILTILARNLRVEWDVMFSDLQSISLEPTGIALKLRGGVAGPFIALPEAESRAWFFQQVQRVVLDYNQSRSGVE